MGIELSPDLYPLHDTDEVFDSTREAGVRGMLQRPQLGCTTLLSHQVSDAGICGSPVRRAWG